MSGAVAARAAAAKAAAAARSLPLPESAAIMAALPSKAVTDRKCGAASAVSTPLPQPASRASSPALVRQASR
jgi:hypothetical protein